MHQPPVPNVKRNALAHNDREHSMKIIGGKMKTLGQRLKGYFFIEMLVDIQKSILDFRKMIHISLPILQLLMLSITSSGHIFLNNSCEYQKADKKPKASERGPF